MNSTELLRRLHEHRRWANHRLLDTAEQLNHEQLHQAYPIGQGSIWKTLTHLYAAEYVWLEALTGNESPLTPGDARGKLPGNQEGEGAMASLTELRARWRELDQRWVAYLAALEPESLSETVYKNNSVSGQRLPTQRSDILIHVCTHAQYTTAQLVNMLRQAGQTDLPDVMLISMAREGSAFRPDK
ncbi:DinB family protein [Fuerstiella marisgermanici]|uniref:DinB family protein n=1 Tax=Fuerstiella marisgermanici TaxID=1891926 RepID=A0A1P8WH57_9PLAN|nr:DinB family protein [Fuerstiella marisgermanici]APZ93357.1 DinB family protein [Fuerstiella marisgermanici]